MKYIIFIAIILSLSSHIKGETTKCSPTLTTLKGASGTIEIDRKTGCMVEADFAFLGISSQNLQLIDDDHIIVKPGSENETEVKIIGPTVADYYVFATKVQLTFHLNSTDGIILIDYFQGDPAQSKDLVPLNLGLRSGNILIQSYWEKQYRLDVSTSQATVHLQILDSVNTFNHRLIKDKEIISVSGNYVSITFNPVRSDCSEMRITKDATAVQVKGPSVDTIKDAYRCVNIFQFSGNDHAHFDIDFSDFTGITDQKDELKIDDGQQSLHINSYGAAKYSNMKPVVSFQGPNLAITYDSPQKFSPKEVLKLTVKPQTVGGIVNQYQPLSMPATGLVRYTFPSQNDGGIPALQISGKLANDLTIYDAHNRILKVAAGDFAPSIIALPQDAAVEFNIKTKTSATVTYKKETKCSGTIFGSSGTISIGGGKQTCVWLIGSKSTIRVDAHNLQHPESCLKIYSFDHEKPVFEKCNLDPAMLLPPLTLGPAYLNITTASNSSKFEATISNALENKTVSSSGMQTRYSSSGYPSSYIWSPFPENFSIDSKNRTVVLSVENVDIRAGEKLTIDSTEINSQNYLTFEDFDVSNKATSISVARSLATTDFNIHKGYSLVTSTYQSIMNVDVSKKTISTQKNQTSLLLRIKAAEKNRIDYSIMNVTSSNQNFVMNVIDSRSVLGRKVPDEEKYKSSTTSNILLISLTTIKANTTLPEFTIAFSQVSCNQTTDHVCDQSTRCVPAAKLCKGISHCQDGSDLRVQCSSGPTPRPPVVPKEGYGGFTVFSLMILMFSLGIVAAIYGPDAYKNLDSRFRSGQYTTFTSTE